VVWKAKGPSQPTYFGFSFDATGHLIVSEPFGASATIPAKPASAVSSFSIGHNGSLTAVTTDLANGQALACWVAIDPVTGQYAFIGNNGSGTISSYHIDLHGGLTLLNPAAGSGVSGPNDLAVARDGNKRFLYALAAGSGSINGWIINSDGSLTSLGSPLTGLVAGAGAQGLAAY
jgi:6-phosphogluconolactonase (cycloisomerase 2 family)